MAKRFLNLWEHPLLNTYSRVVFFDSSYVSTRFLTISHESDPSHFHAKHSRKASPNGSALSADGCERLRTVADGCGRSDNESRTRLYPPRPPEFNANPSLRIQTLKHIKVAARMHCALALPASHDVDHLAPGQGHRTDTWKARFHAPSSATCTDFQHTAP